MKMKRFAWRSTGLREREREVEQGARSSRRLLAASLGSGLRRRLGGRLLLLFAVVFRVRSCRHRMPFSFGETHERASSLTSYKPCGQIVCVREKKSAIPYPYEKSGNALTVLAVLVSLGGSSLLATTLRSRLLCKIQISDLEIVTPLFLRFTITVVRTHSPSSSSFAAAAFLPRPLGAGFSAKRLFIIVEDQPGHRQWETHPSPPLPPRPWLKPSWRQRPFHERSSWVPPPPLRPRPWQEPSWRQQPFHERSSWVPPPLSLPPRP